MTHVWNFGSIVLERNASGAVVNRFHRGVGHLISSDHHGYYLFNVRGDVIQRVDSAGNVIHTYRYDAFGNEQNQDEVNTNPFRFAGEYYDFETGFIYLRARFYNPVLGRFISEDPFWTIHNMQSNTAAIIQSSNLYMYCMHNPVRFVDPSGLFFIVRGDDGMYSIVGFSGVHVTARLGGALIPVVGGTMASRLSNWMLPGTFVGEAHWSHRSGTILSLDPTYGMDLAWGYIVYRSDSIIARAVGAKTVATGLSVLWAAGRSGDREKHSRTILGLMHIHNIENSFSSLESLMSQVAELDRIIMNNPRYFYYVCTLRNRNIIMYGNFAGSQFLRDWDLYNRSDFYRSRVFSNRAGVRFANWSDEDFNRAQDAFVARMRSVSR